MVSISEICALGPVIPVIEIDESSNAVPMAQALINAGIGAVEITLRTDQALNAIEAIANLGSIYVGAGTLFSDKDVQQAKSAGAQFGVSPGSSDDLIEACIRENLPLLPGAVTPTEVSKLSRQGFKIQKFFPAEAAGGAPMLKALAGPIGDVKFCPTGGITLEKAPTYLSLQNVICIGGSWVAPRNLIARQAWDEIEENARFTATLKNETNR